MRVVMFYHSIVSDWNHTNAHFLRGVVTEMTARGHDVTVFEPKDGWSRQSLMTEHGREALRKFRRAYPHISYSYYNTDNLNLDLALDGAELVMVHELNERALVSKIGEHRKKGGGTGSFSTTRTAASWPELIPCPDTTSPATTESSHMARQSAKYTSRAAGPGMHGYGTKPRTCVFSGR